MYESNISNSNVLTNTCLPLISCINFEIHHAIDLNFTKDATGYKLFAMLTHAIFGEAKSKPIDSSRSPVFSTSLKLTSPINAFFEEELPEWIDNESPILFTIVAINSNKKEIPIYEAKIPVSALNSFHQYNTSLSLMPIESLENNFIDTKNVSRLTN